MRNSRALVQLAAVLLIVASLLACQRLPKGNWRIETGRARLVDELGATRPRIEAVAEAQEDARVKLMRYIEEMPASGDLMVGDFIVQNPRLGQRLRDLAVSARRLRTRYKDEVVEIDMGVNLGDVHRLMAQAGAGAVVRGAR